MMTMGDDDIKYDTEENFTDEQISKAIEMSEEIKTIGDLVRKGTPEDTAEFADGIRDKLQRTAVRAAVRKVKKKTAKKVAKQAPSKDTYKLITPLGSVFTKSNPFTLSSNNKKWIETVDGEFVNLDAVIKVVKMKR